MLSRLRLNNQRGDTIIEVFIALTILSITLFNAYALSSNSAQLGLSARERAQATQLVQHQAEGLRYLRDSQTWEDFRSTIPSFGTFHLRLNSSGEWERVGGEGSGTAIMDSDSFELYTVAIEGSYTDSDDKFTARISVSWDFLSGPSEPVVTTITLVNTGVIASNWSPSPTPPPPPTPDPGDTEVPTTPTNFRATLVSFASIRLGWSTVAAADYYEIERLAPHQATYSPITGTTYNNSFLSPGTTYRYRIRAVNEAGASNWSGVINVTTLSLGGPRPGPDPCNPACI